MLSLICIFASKSARYSLLLLVLWFMVCDSRWRLAQSLHLHIYLCRFFESRFPCCTFFASPHAFWDCVCHHNIYMNSWRSFVKNFCIRMLTSIVCILRSFSLNGILLIIWLGGGRNNEKVKIKLHIRRYSSICISGICSLVVMDLQVIASAIKNFRDTCTPETLCWFDDVRD